MYTGCLWQVTKNQFYLVYVLYTTGSQHIGYFGQLIT
jgi:hypothetical protein